MPPGRGQGRGRGGPAQRPVSAGAANWRGALAALLGAILVNAALFGVAPMLTDGDMPDPGPRLQPGRLFLPPPDQPPPPEDEPPPPEPPKPPPELTPQVMDMAKLDAPRPQMEPPRLDMELNTRLNTGLAVAPPGPVRYGLGDVDKAPAVTARIPPTYPFLARRRGVEGAVQVRFLVTKEGRVQHLEIIKAQPQGVFEEAVLSSVRRWRFRPGVKDSQAVDTWVETTIRFELEGR